MPTSDADAEPVGSDCGQTASDADQTASDADQTASDADQAASTIDQAQSDLDQTASDRDQAASDRDHASRGGTGVDVDYEVSRIDRIEGTLARDQNALLRMRTATERDRRADRRDELARMRDLASDERDRVAEARDAAATEAEGRFDAVLELDHEARERIAAERRRIVEARTRAAADREQAARDRADAAENRREAAADREQAAHDRRHASIDELTGAYRRGVGLMAFERELERSRRKQTPLCLAFVDVDGLKRTNDLAGHAAGDALLRRVGSALTAELRPYDSVVRIGGDEFACAIADADLETSRTRFERIAANLAAGPDGASISIGLVVVGRDESVDEALTRADTEMRRTRTARWGSISP